MKKKDRRHIAKNNLLSKMFSIKMQAIVFIALTIVFFWLAILCFAIESTYFEPSIYRTIYAIFFYLTILSGIGVIFFVLRDQKALKFSDIPRLLLVLLVLYGTLKVHLYQIDIFREKQSVFLLAESGIEKIGNALINDTKISKGYLPVANHWSDLLLASNSALIREYFSSSYTGNIQSTVAFNKHLDGILFSEISQYTILLFEADGEWNLNGDKNLFSISREKDKYFSSEDKIFIYIYFADQSLAKYRLSDGAIATRVPGTDVFTEYTKDSPYLPLRWDP